MLGEIIMKSIDKTAQDACGTQPCSLRNGVLVLAGGIGFTESMDYFDGID